LRYTRACEYHIGSFDVSVTTGWPSGRPKRAPVAVCWKRDNGRTLFRPAMKLVNKLDVEMREQGRSARPR
jgi:hypothetical protein